MSKISRAIISVTDKTGIVDFCKGLTEFNVEILSTGGTARVLREAGVTVKDVAEYTGSPEIMDGRLKTLHPKIEGGILGIRGNAQHVKEMKANGIEPIDLVLVNLYEFEKTVAKKNVALDDAVENIDIGGPTMLRAAAKNYPDVSVVVDPADYDALLDEMRKKGGAVSKETNFKLAAKVFQRTSAYDTAISHYLDTQVASPTPSSPHALTSPSLTLTFQKIQDLRYGENPHQKAAVYRESTAGAGALVNAKQLHGKELSFNNFIDLEGALSAVREFEDPACVIIKHTNPCGAAIGDNLADAFARALEGDPVSSFGGIIGLNRKVDAPTAQAISKIFFECVIAPSYDDEAKKILMAKKNIRLMELNPFRREGDEMDYKRVEGGLLVQEKDEQIADIRSCKVPTKRKPTDNEYRELDFAWRACKHVKSNAILFSKNKQIIGVGAGQMSRVDSVKIAVMKSQKPLKGAVMASDAFFPFRDALDEAIKQGIKVVVQPGGSVRDEDVIKAADEQGVAMVFTGMRHFRH